MARYKHIDTSPRFFAVDLEKQLLPGSFAHAVHHLLDQDFDLSGFDARYHNDSVGAPALPPGMLLKVILCAYAEGVVSSRGMERLCREHVTFIALSGDTAPHFTTLAAFVSSLGLEVASLFAQVLFLCNQQPVGCNNRRALHRICGQRLRALILRDYRRSPRSLLPISAGYRPDSTRR